MHAYSLWWKLLTGKHRAPSQTSKMKTKTKKKAGLARTTDPSSIQSSGDHGPRKTTTRAAAPPAEDVDVIGSLLGAMGPRRLRAMTSRSRVGGSKYKVNNQNLEKFEVILAKIPEGERVTKPVSSVTSLPERHEDITRLTTTTQGDKTERPAPDISPSLTMGSSVTAEYELFCKEFHSDAKKFLPDEKQPTVSSNPMRQLLQSASEAAHKNQQLQRVTTLAGSTASVDGSIAGETERTLPKTSEPMIPKVPGFVTSVLGTPTTGSPPVASVATTSRTTSPQPPQPASATTTQKASKYRRWSETPIGTPVFMAKKFADKIRKSMDSPLTGVASGGGSRKGSMTLEQDPNQAAAAATSSSKPETCASQSAKLFSKHVSVTTQSGSGGSPDQLEERSREHRGIQDSSGASSRPTSVTAHVSADVQKVHPSTAAEVDGETTQPFEGRSTSKESTTEALDETGTKHRKAEETATTVTASKTEKRKHGKKNSSKRKKR